jgi:hypothetical protein
MFSAGHGQQLRLHNPIDFGGKLGERVGPDGHDLRAFARIQIEIMDQLGLLTIEYASAILVTDDRPTYHKLQSMN